MAVTDEKERRTFVRETAAQLASAAAITLNRENAAGLADFCRKLKEDAAAFGITPIAELASACEGLCAAGREGGDQLLKECFAAIQSSLVKGPAAGFAELIAKIGAVTRSGESEWDELERLIASSFRGTRTSTEAPSTAVDRLLTGMSRLAARLEQEPRFREDAFEVAGAAHEAHSIGFERVCFELTDSTGDLHIETPEARMEESRSAIARDCLDQWLRASGPVSGASASLRLVGPHYWVELRIPSRVGAPGGTVDAPSVPGVAAMEQYTLRDGTRVWRAAIPAALPAFEAHRIHAGRRTFLVPACDVHGMPNRIPAGMEKVTIEHLLELPEEDEPPKGGRVPVMISCRGKVVAVEADSVSGRETFLARAVEDAGAGNRGIAGIARTAEGARAVVLDLVPWLEVHAEKGGVGPTVEAHDEPRPASGYVVFKASGKRYAVPLKSVLGVGSLPGDAWLMGVVESQRGVFHLRDVKASLGLEGTAGGVYVIIQGSRGAVAWAVDGIERLAVQDVEGVRPLAPLGQAARAALFRGILLPARRPGSTNGAPIYLLNPDALIGGLTGRRAA